MSNNSVTQISKEEDFTFSSKLKSIKPDQQYKISASVKGIEGKPYATYFAVIILTSDMKEIDRKIKWINSFDEISSEYTIIFTTNSEAKNILVRFVSNQNTPMRHNAKIVFPDPEKLIIKETQHLTELFDDRNDFHVYLEELTTSEEEIMERNMIWIFVTARSGTTWLARDLLNHLVNVLWFEPQIARHVGIPRNIVGIETGNPSFLEPELKKISNHHYIFSNQYRDIWLRGLRKLILNRAYAISQTLKKNIIIKEPLGAEDLSNLMLTFPKSKLIFLVRDGRDVVDSQFDRHTPNSWARKRGKKLLSLESVDDRCRMINYYSSMWNVTMSNIMKVFKKHDSELHLLVRYEDLRFNTFDELRRIYEFLDILIDENELKAKIEFFSFENIPEPKKGFGKFFRSAKPGNWKNNFIDSEQKLMNSIMGDMLKKLGYTI